MTYIRARYYSDELGRFVSRDPMNWDMGVSTSKTNLNDRCQQSLNKFCYSGYGLGFTIYHDGMNLYFGYFIPNGIDPNGLKNGDLPFVLPIPKDPDKEKIADTSCDPISGKAVIRNTKDGCTKVCSQKHEEVHKKQLEDIGICKAAHQAYKAGKDLKGIKDKLEKWYLDNYHGKLECAASQAGYDCAKQLYESKKCDCPKDEWPQELKDCCSQLQSYKNADKKYLEEKCKGGGAKPSPIPKF